MKTNRITIAFIAISIYMLAFSSLSFARENVGGSITNQSNNQNKGLMGQCINTSAQVDLDINNVRAKILNGGDMWWDIFGSSTARYQVPKVTNADGSAGIGPSSQFATSLWIGGYDAGGQLKAAAQTYRQFGGNDFWAGPLTSTATTDAATCLTWDKFWKINRSDVQAYFNWVTNDAVGPNPASSAAMDVITTWPAYGPEGQALAPYFDYNTNGIYDPENGDVPDFDITGTRGCAAQLFGDQCIYWVFNDKGNIHTETGCAAIGLEVQAQAFAFATTDELNNATFLKYKIINKSSFRLDSTFFGIWDDADLGYAFDDYVGCDVERGLGILYNGPQLDGTGQADAYGVNPPAVGIDFFEGPYADPDGLDNAGYPNVPKSFTNYGDITIDNERLGMCKFLYFNNTTNAVNGNPTAPDDHYQYLTGTWRNGAPVTYGGDGTSASGTPCDYMFPGTSDPLGFGTNKTPQSPWYDQPPANDRRFVESAGPFKLQPGAVNTVTVGVPWARATQGGPLASVALLLGVDDKAQELFNNCFATLDGPTAPNLTIQELDKQLILYWSNPKGSNNYNEKYTEDYDKTSSSDSLYRFQGYQVYQLKDGSVSLTDLQDINKSRLVFQCDKTDAISQIVNYYNDPTISAMIPKEMVNGANTGISHSCKVTEDKFASGDNHLINHKTYYFAIIAYGFSPTKVPANLNIFKDYLPYIAGRKNSDASAFTQHAAIPHIPSPEANGTEQHSDYGTGPKLRRIEGQGNGGNVLDLTSETVSRILADPSNRVIDPLYENSHGPVSIKVIDPLNVPDGEFTLKLDVIPSIKYNSLNQSFQVGETIIDSVAANDVAKAVITSDNGILMHIGSIVKGLNNRPFVFEDQIEGRISGATATVVCYGSGGIANATWVMSSSSSEEYSDATIMVPNDQIINGQPIGPGQTFIPKWGLSVSVKTVYNPGPRFIPILPPPPLPAAQTITVYEPFLEATETFADPSKIWLTGVADEDGETDANWIRSGTATFTPNAYGDILGQDDQQIYEKVLGGTWAPYRLCASTPLAPPLVCRGGPAWSVLQNLTLMKNLASIDVIIDYSDPSHWTRCPVLEMQEEKILAIRGARKLDMRKSLSVGKNGIPYDTTGLSIQHPTWTIDSIPASSIPSDANYNGGTGMGWFPGYAINIETGERLNMAFGEDSWLPGENGTDMLWNPTSNTFSSPGYDPLFGGKHYIYVFGHNGDAKYSNDAQMGYGFKDVPRYDEGKTAHDLLKAADLTQANTPASNGYKRELFIDAMWVNIPLLNYNHSLFETPVKIRLRVAKAYQKGYTASSVVLSDTSLSPLNRNYPMYSFNTADIKTNKNDKEAAKNALDIINIVPNPYYAYSGYEATAAEKKVKITNLPEKCTVSIYTLSGTLIRKFNKDDPKTSLDWNLENQIRVPISSGMYIIYINVPNVGEKTLKWFGIMRPLDLESY